MPERLRVQTLGGGWETLGVDRHPGVFPEGIAPSWNRHGPDGLTFTIRRDPALEHADLEGDTPIDYLPDGERVTWSGYTIEAPGATGNDPTITVQARGWQHHADDDMVSRAYVHENLGDWIAIRDHPDTVLGATSGTTHISPSLAVDAEAGRILIGARPGLKWKAGAVVGIMLDLGPEPPYPVTVAFNARRVAGNPGNLLHVRNHATPPTVINAAATLFEDSTPATVDFSTISTASALFLRSFITPRRYVSIFLLRSTGAADYTASDEDLLEITAIRTFTDGAYNDGNGNSILTADKIIKDLRDRACPLLDPSNALVTAAALNLREFRVDDETPRAGWERVNGYHAWRLKVRHDRRVEFGPLPDRPVLVVNTTDPGVEFRDASRQSTADVVNKVIVRGRSASGKALRVILFAPVTGSATMPPTPTVTSGTITDPEWLEVDPGGVMTSSQGQTVAGLGEGNVLLGITASGSPMPAGTYIAGRLGGTYLAGRRYVIRFDLGSGWASSAPASITFRIEITDAAGQVLASREIIAPNLGGVTSGGGTFRALRETITFTPATNLTGGLIRFRSTGDDVQIANTTLEGGDNTIPGRRGKHRTRVLDVQAPTVEAAMTSLGNAYLTVNQRTSFKGDLTISSDTAVRRIGSEEPIPTSDLGLHTTELILLENFIDPDTGDVGRNGIIAAVNGGASGSPATLTLDNDRANFEALLARMGIITRAA